jgi:polyisoprenoid-binding protein YceI
MKPRLSPGVVLPMVLAAAPAWSDQISLHPPDSSVELRSYGFGWFPLDGKFTRFQGWMRYDPANPGACQMTLEIEAESLVMSNDAIRDVITGPGVMDVARFPTLGFDGTCHGEAIIGDLTMHGETHPVSLDFARSAGAIIATGELRRADWGITGSQLLGGSVIRIRVRVPDFAGGQQT